MRKWNMIVDVARCHDCNNCFLADKDEFVDNDWPLTALSQPRHGHRWLNIMRKERGQYPLVDVAYLPLLCQHCDDAPCMKDSPAGTIYKRDDGLVIIDPIEAKGHREILGTCPYGVIYYNEEKDLPQKCTGCAHLMDEGWTETRCTQVCPTGALTLVLGEEAELKRKAAAEGLEAYLPEFGSQPRIYFKNLHRWNSAFLAGNVVYKDSDACAEGVKVTVSQNGSPSGSALTNNYGDFKVDKLTPGSHTLTLEAPDYKSQSLPVSVTEKGTSLASLFLERS
jgi:Fe-S-cluster-containing dehydrogenase component